MIQLVVNGIFLDLYENDPPKLTYSIEDITDTRVTTVFSKNFRVPATTKNREFFKSAFEVNGYDFDVTVRIDATILDNGTEIRKGQIRLQKIYLTNGTEAADYELLFLGETRTLASEIGDKLVNQLDLSGLNTTLSYNNITASWNAYPQTSISGGLVSGNLLFPLVDFGNTYSGSSYVIEQGSPTLGGAKSFLNSSYGISVNRFKPMVRAKYVWDQIFSASNFTYESEFLESNLFKQAYISAWGNDTSITFNSASVNTFEARNDSLQYIYQAPAAAALNSSSFKFREVTDLGNNYSGSAPEGISGIYTAPSNGSYTFIFSIYHHIYFDSGVTLASWLANSFDCEFTFRIRKKSGGVYSNLNATTWYEDTVDANGEKVYEKSSYASRYIAGRYTRIQTSTLLAGDEVFIELYYPSVGNEDVRYFTVYPDLSYFKCTGAPGNMAIAPLIKNDYKQIDFIKDIATKFRLVFARDKYNPNKFIIEPWQQYIGTGDIFDWTGKLDVSKDIVVEPVFNTQTKIINYKDKEDGDYWNKYNENAYGEIFGTRKDDSQNELLSGERDITTNLSPTIVTQLRDWTFGNPNAETFIIPQVYTVETQPGVVLYKPVVPNTRLLFYNGLVDPGNISGDVTPSWYMIDEGGTAKEIINQYPKVSPYSTDEIGLGTIDLNWQRESGYFYDDANYPDDTTTYGKTVYDLYWSDYITSIYSKWGRKITAYFILDSTDLVEFSFDDVIFVKNAYYYVSKIYDVPLGQKESVKVDLIKLLDFDVPGDGFIPPTPITPSNVWGTWGVVWEVTTDTWDD